MSPSPCLHVSISPCLHVSRSPCLQAFRPPCLHVSMSMSPRFRNSANGKWNQWKTATSVYFLQTENGNGKLPFVCCKRKRKNWLLFSLVGKRQTVINDCFSNRAHLYFNDVIIFWEGQYSILLTRHIRIESVLHSPCNWLLHLGGAAWAGVFQMWLISTVDFCLLLGQDTSALHRVLLWCP